MSSNKKYGLPNAELIQDAYNTFSSLSAKLIELNNLHLEQSKAFWQAGMASTQTLYQVSTPDEFAQTLSNIMQQQGALYSKHLMEDINIMLKMCREVCGCSALSAKDAQTGSLKLFDFYTKLLPSPLLYKFDDVIKSAAVGNHDAVNALQKVVENAIQNFGSAIEGGAKSTLTNLNKLAENQVKPGRK